MSPHRDRYRRIHVCMKEPCAYCAARANAHQPPDRVGGYADLITAVANELRRRTVRSTDHPGPRKKKR